MGDLSLDADVDLLPTEQGGRRGPILSGYRPALWFGETGPTGEPELHSALVQLKSRPELRPGERGRVSISPLAYETWPHVKPGMHFDLFDGRRTIGSGSLRTAPRASATEPALRRALGQALEEWVLARFGDQVARRPRRGKRLEPDLVARFNDDGQTHSLIAEVLARKPGKRDIDRLARMMELHSAVLGVIVALDEPSASTLDAIYHHGTVPLTDGTLVPRVRVVTVHDMVHKDIDLFPMKRQPEALELLAA